MIYTTTCNAEEFESIKKVAMNNGLQVTAAPGFIYKKGNWIVGNTLEDEAHFNARIESEAVTPETFLIRCLFKQEQHIRSMFITCATTIQRDEIIDHFILMGYSGHIRNSDLSNGLAVCVVPAEKTVMVTFEYVARQNAKEGYTMIDFETFKTITG